MASITKDDELSSFDVPETRQLSGNTMYKIVLQVTPKELTENSYQVYIIQNNPREKKNVLRNSLIFVVMLFSSYIIPRYFENVLYTSISTASE